MILRLVIKPMDEHNEAATSAFPSSVVNLRLSIAVKLHASTQGLLNIPTQEIAVPETTYKLCPTGVLTYHLQLVNVASVMVIRRVLPPTPVNGKKIAVK